MVIKGRSFEEVSVIYVNAKSPSCLSGRTFLLPVYVGIVLNECIEIYCCSDIL